jgi:PPOX class probable F420-dependent enzyme
MAAVPLLPSDAGASTGATEMGMSHALIDRLERQSVVWLGSVSPDGRPHLLPLWFTWDDEAVTVFSKPHARKVRNVRREPRVMLAIGDAGVQLDTLLVEAHAREVAVDDLTDVDLRRLDRYDLALAELGLTRHDFLAIYSRCLRLEPQRVLDWGASRPPIRGLRAGALA